MSYGVRLRARKANQFVQIDNAFLRDQELSIEARGVGAYLLTHAEGFVVSAAMIGRVCGTGRDKTRRILKELEDAGYLLREHERDGGRFALATFSMSDEKAQVAPVTENPSPDDQSPENDAPNKKTNSKNTKVQEDLSEGDAEAPPDLLEASLPLNGKEAWTEEQRRAEYEQTPPPEEFSAKHVVAAYIDSFRVTSKGKDPVGRFIAQVGREAKRLIDQGIEPSAILAAAHALGKTQFATLENQYMRSLAGVPTGAQNGRSRTSVVPPPDVLAERKAWFEEHAEPAAPAAVYNGPQF